MGKKKANCFRATDPTEIENLTPGPLKYSRYSPRVGLRSTIPVRQVGDMCRIDLVGLLSPVIFFRSLKSAASRAGRDNTAALVIRAKVPHAIHAQASIYTTHDPDPGLQYHNIMHMAGHVFGTLTSVSIFQ